MKEERKIPFFFYFFLGSGTQGTVMKVRLNITCVRIVKICQDFTFFYKMYVVLFKLYCE